MPPVASDRPGIANRSVPCRTPTAVSMHRLFPYASFVGCGDVIVTNAVDDSRQVSPGALFAAIEGTRQDGAEFVADAVRRGADAILCSRPLADVSVPQIIVPDVRRAWSRLCGALTGDPDRLLKITGITGTNGKSTTAWLMRSILQAAGRRCGLIGTVEYSSVAETVPARLTTPDARSIYGWFRRMVDGGCTHAAIELSSHALHQGRIAGIPLAAAIVSNITQDHFDYHGNWQAYLAAKARIFEYVAPSGSIVLNLDDPGCRQLLDSARATGRRVITTSTQPDQHADFHATTLSSTLTGSRFQVTGPGWELIGTERAHSANVFTTPMPGRHNIQNCLAALAAALSQGIPLEAIREGLASDHTVPGRLQRIDSGQPFECFVDYAHTDDALRRVVQSLKRLTSGRVLCVFGAGGDRDRTKRPLLAEAASHADLAIVTSDNPRTEQPEAIIDEIVAGFPAGGAQHIRQTDRRKAIALALSEARPGDCVLIAGKGHEAEQTIGTQTLPFDDREVARELLAELVGRTHPERQSA